MGQIEVVFPNLEPCAILFKKTFYIIIAQFLSKIVRIFLAVHIFYSCIYLEIIRVYVEDVADNRGFCEKFSIL